MDHARGLRRRRAPYTEYAFASLHLFTNGNAYADLVRLYATTGVVDTAVEVAAFQIAV